MASSLHRCCILKFRLVTFIPSPHPGQNYLIRHKHGIKEKQKKVPNIKSMFKKDTANGKPFCPIGYLQLVWFRSPLPNYYSSLFVWFF